MKTKLKQNSTKQKFLFSYLSCYIIGGVGFVGDYSPLYGRHARAEISFDGARQHFSHDSRICYARPQFYPYQGLSRCTNYERWIGTLEPLNSMKEQRQFSTGDFVSFFYYRKPILKELLNSVPFATNWFLWRSNERTNLETMSVASCRKKITRRNRTLRGWIHDPPPTWRNFILLSDTVFSAPNWGILLFSLTHSLWICIHKLSIRFYQGWNLLPDL